MWCDNCGSTLHHGDAVTHVGKYNSTTDLCSGCYAAKAQAMCDDAEAFAVIEADTGLRTVVV